jgi:hypothetical protein
MKIELEIPEGYPFTWGPLGPPTTIYSAPPFGGTLCSNGPEGRTFSCGEPSGNKEAR